MAAKQKPTRSKSADEIDDPHPDGEFGEYKSTRGWDPYKAMPISERALERKKERAREKYQREEAARSAIEVRTAAEWIEDASRSEPRRDLFPPFWREGELAVLTGPPGVGKSFLALQLAAALASGTHAFRSSPPYEGGVASRAGVRDDRVVLSSSPVTRPSSLQVLYLDLERTDRQIAEIYADHKFSEHLEYGLLADVEMPGSYNGRRERFYLDAVGHALADSEAPVVIIDNLSWLTRSSRAAELHSVMRAFRRWVNETGRSMLVLRHSREDVAMHNQPAAFEMADSVFALCRSTMGNNIRYVKALRQGFRMQSGQRTMENSSEDCPLSTINYPLNEVLALRLTESDPFFDFSGISPEELHLFDYAAHVKRVNRRLEEITQLHAPPLKLVPETNVNFLEITGGNNSDTDC